MKDTTEPKDSELAARLELAARIIREGLPWQWLNSDNEWKDPICWSIVEAIHDKREIRIRPDLTREELLALCGGREPHRLNGWKREWLEDGWRPLLAGERTPNCIESCDQYTDNDGRSWAAILIDGGHENWCASDTATHRTFVRTRRPLPPAEPTQEDLDRQAFEQPYEVAWKRVLKSWNEGEYEDVPTQIAWKHFQRGCAHARKERQPAVPAEPCADPVVERVVGPVKLRHADKGAMEVVIDEWVYVRINYNYRYTDNAHRAWLGREIVKLLTEDAKDQHPEAPASDDECRRQFEHQYQDSYLQRRPSGCYHDPQTEDRWLAFSNGWLARGKEGA